jgi:hypothetical protein
MKLKKNISLSLLNYEGDALKAYRIKNYFVITDQWGVGVDVLTQEGIENFINGRTAIIDSNGKSWVYTEHHSNAKQKTHILSDFITNN